LCCDHEIPILEDDARGVKTFLTTGGTGKSKEAKFT
jgi:hypothetical protein